MPLFILIGALVAGMGASLFVTGWRLRVFRVVANESLLPKIQLWLTIIMAQSALWVVCSFYLAATFRRLKTTAVSPLRHMRAASLTLLPTGIVLIFLGAKQYFLTAPLPPATLGEYTISNLPIFGGIGMLVAGWAVWQMYMVRSVWDSEFDLPWDDGQKIMRYVQLREDALRLLFIAGIVLALGTVAGAALRNAVNADRGPNYFPEEYVIIYGALYSLLLLIAYVPVYATFFATGVKLRETLCGERPASAAGFKQWKEARDAVNEALGLTLSGAAALGPPLAALLPVFSGWAVSLLSAKK
jgi:hypothetical protein